MSESMKVNVTPAAGRRPTTSELNGIAPRQDERLVGRHEYGPRLLLLDHRTPHTGLRGRGLRGRELITGPRIINPKDPSIAC